MTIETTDSKTTAIIITDAAAARIRDILQQENDTHAALRIAVDGGGCSGFQYRFEVEKHTAGAHDTAFNKDGATVLVDDISLQFLGGSTLDFVESLAGSSFEIRNPNSTASCGCGNSFSIV